VATSPAWKNTVLVLNHDEWGVFFDHIPPPRALAPNNTDPDLVDGKALLGCRAPCIVASPWTVGVPSNPAVNHTVFDHTSVLKMIESVFNVQPQPVTPQKICLSSINPGGGLVRPDAEPNSFQRLEQAAKERGWPVYP